MRTGAGKLGRTVRESGPDETSMTMTNSSLYFAYGSNLNFHDWSNWCHENGAGHLADELRCVGAATLPDRRLAFTRRSVRRDGGVLDVVPARGHVVEGVLFEANDVTWELLDAKEGERLGHIDGFL